jgi:hypothetical protein
MSATQLFQLSNPVANADGGNVGDYHLLWYRSAVTSAHETHKRLRLINPSLAARSSASLAREIAAISEHNHSG